MTDPLIISCALVGAELDREIYPFLPLTPEEIAVAAQEAVEAGAAIIHLHVRDRNGHPSQDPEIFREVSELITSRCDCILQFSTGGAVGTPVEERYAPLILQPEMATLSMGTMNFGREIYENSDETIRTIADRIQQYSITPELEIFDMGMLESVGRYVDQGIISRPFHIDFVLGVPGGMGAGAENLVLLTNRLEKDQTWSVAALGRHQLPLTTMAIAMGGHVRVGIEDNIYYRKGEMVRSNAQLVARAGRIAGELERPVASVEEAREILGLSGRME